MTQSSSSFRWKAGSSGGCRDNVTELHFQAVLWILRFRMRKEVIFFSFYHLCVSIPVWWSGGGGCWKPFKLQPSVWLWRAGLWQHRIPFSCLRSLASLPCDRNRTSRGSRSLGLTLIVGKMARYGFKIIRCDGSRIWADPVQPGLYFCLSFFNRLTNPP